jgi:hypothetical protein
MRNRSPKHDAPASLLAVSREWAAFYCRLIERAGHKPVGRGRLSCADYEAALSNQLAQIEGTPDLIEPDGPTNHPAN